jgi:PAS domain S-box-containing protein
LKTENKDDNELLQELEKLKTRIHELEDSQTRHRRLEEQISKLSSFREKLISKRSLDEKLKLITDFIIKNFDADFARIWMIKEGDHCEKACTHAKVTEGPHVCYDKTRCLHLMVSSGRYTHIDGGHQRVPFGCYKIGRVASGEYPRFITNDVTHDPQVHDHEWAKALGLVSFAGFRLISPDGNPIGVLALFSKHKIDHDEEKLLEDISNTTSQVILVGQSEIALQKSETKYRTLFERSGNAIIFIDEDTTISLANAELELLSGYSKEEVEGKKSWTDFVAKKDDLERMMKYHKLRRTDPKNTPSSYEFQLIGKHGQLKDVLVTVSMIPGTNKSLASLIDITQRKKFERDLLESEEKFREVFNNANDALFLLKVTERGLNEYFIEVNDVACRSLGYNLEELLQMSPSDIDGSDPVEVDKKMEKIVKKGYYTFETVFISKNSQKIPVEINARIFYLNGEKVLLAISRDITERKKSEKKLKLANLYNRSLIEASLDPLVTIGAIGKINDINNAVEQVTGYKRDQIIGTDFSDYFTHPQKAKEGYKQVFRDGFVKDYPLEIQHKDGHITPVLYNASLYHDEEGKVIGIVAAARDITEAKKAEKELQKSLKEKEMLLKEIHHRVKNNLMVISSLLSLQSEYIHDKEDLDVFKESQSRARTMALIHERLYQSTDLKNIDFGDYIRTLAMELFRTYQIDPGRVKLNINAEDLKLDINTAIPLGLIVNELVSNSMKHAFPEEKSGEIKIDFYKTDNSYLLMVSDNGVGFPADLDFQMTESLGLQLVNSLVGQIDATINLDRTEGTSFTIKFKEMEI